jgi:plasmid stability protein
MSRTVQIRDLPDDVHQVVRLRAARQGVSLAEYLRREITRLARRADVAEFLHDAEQLAVADAPGPTTGQIVEAVRADRDRR